MIKPAILPRYSTPASRVQESGISLGDGYRLQAGWTLRGARRAVRRWASATGHPILLSALLAPSRVERCPGSPIGDYAELDK